MNKPAGYDEVKAFNGDFESLPADGYVCKILKVEETQSSTHKDMLKVYLDIAEGDYKAFFSDKFKNDTRETKKWGCVLNQLVLDNEGKTNKGYKALITSIEESNSGFTVTWGEGFCKSLTSKLVGVLFGEEEYLGTNDGKVHTNVKPRFVRSADTIRNGKYTIPEKKTLPPTADVNRGFNPVDAADEDSLPF